MRLIRTNKLLCLLAVVSLLGCGSEETKSPPSQYFEAKERWSALAIPDYRFTLKTTCFCLAESDIVVIVAAGVLDSAFYVDTGTAPSEERMSRLFTLDGLFEIIADAYARKAAVVHVTYNSIAGFPEDVYIDYVSNLADEEIRYTIRDFQPLLAFPADTSITSDQ